MIDLVTTKFGISVFKIECSIERAKEIVIRAAECLRGEKRPDPSNLCEHCQHIAQHIARKEEERKDEDNQIDKQEH